MFAERISRHRQLIKNLLHHSLAGLLLRLGFVLVTIHFAAFFLAIYFTSSIPSKSSSCVHSVASLARAVARTIESAIGSFNSKLNRAALIASVASKSIMLPCCINAIASSARRSPNSRRFQRQTSNIQIVGTTSRGASLTALAKKSAFAPPPRNSIHPDESTTFTDDPAPFQSLCSCL